jgi:hypothetical protein
VPGVQPPAPSQAAAGVKVSPAQLAAPQVVPPPGKAQASVRTPSQAPAQTPLPPQAGRPPTGVPSTAAQWPWASHASH